MANIILIKSDARNIPLPDRSVQCVVTSPPYYGLRDYGVDGQIGLEPTLQEYIENMCLVFDEVWRVLRDDGTVWLNIGDSYAANGYKAGKINNQSSTLQGGKETQAQAASVEGYFDSGLKPKDLMLVPHRLAIALQERGWWVRSDIIWHKPNPMPESVRDRPTKSHEYIFLLTKSPRYFYDADAIREGIDNPPDRRLSSSTFNKVQKIGSAQSSAEYVETVGRNKRTVWTITTKPYSGSHFATFPPELPELCIKAGTSEKGECPECGAPWERVLSEKPKGKDWNREKTDRLSTGNSSKGRVDNNERIYKKQTTIGWQPTCDHGLDPVPQTVLDPFGGSGTTAMVANALGRNAVHLDISAEYLELAKERTGIKAMEEWVNGKRVEENYDDLPLFK